MKKSDKKGLSIFYRLLLSFLLVVTFVSSTTSVVYYVFSKRAIEQQTREQMQTVFTGVESHIRNDFTFFVKDLQLLASNPLLDEFTMSSEIEYELNTRALERLFIKYLDFIHDARGISFIDYSGKERVKVNRSGRIKTYHNISSDQLFSEIAGAAPGSVHIYGPYRNEDGEVIFSMGIHKTDMDIGEFGGAIIIEYGMEHFLHYVSEIKMYDNYPVWLFMPDGDVLKKPDNNEVIFDPHPYLSNKFQGTPLLLEPQKGMIIYQDFSFIPGKSFIRAAISIPGSLLLKDISMILRFLSIVFLISLAATFMIVFKLSRYITEPIVKLAHASSRLAKGELSTSVDIKTSGEVRMLVDSFNKMTSNLQNTTVSKDYFNNIIQSMFDPLIVVSPDYTIRMVNSATCDFLDYPEEEIIGSPVGNIINTELLDNGTKINGYILKGLIDNIETVYTTKNGVEIPVIFSSSVMSGAVGEITGYVCVARDITEIKKAEQELHHMAYYDQLTSLPNRANFLSYLERMLKCTKWKSDYMFAVLFIDLDRFKVVNDSLGHLIGDKLLIEIANRLDECIRITDRVSRSAGNDRISRFGGDEFAVLLNNVKDISSATRVADRIQIEIQKPFIIDGHELFTSASIGIALSASGYESAEDLLRDADSAMYRAKATGKAHAVIFDNDMHIRVSQILQLESDLRTAVDKEEFMVYYQPVVSATDSRITGAEALIRWNHPQQGFISPVDFIPIAEETGLISKIGEWVLRTACAQNKAWQDAGHPNLLMKVNFSSRQFKDDNLTEVVKKVIRETNMPAQLLDVEITETIAMEKSSVRILNQLTAMGLQTSIDDFGTGHSSLGSLTQFPINTIKIDRAFIKDITIDVNAELIIKAIIAMAHSLKMEVVAEGVETEEQLAYLQLQKCDKLQGYLFSPPVPEEEFRKLLEQDTIGPFPINKHSASMV